MIKVTDYMDWFNIYSTAWSGAKDTVERIEDEGKGNEFVSLIEEVYPEGIDRTYLNDLLRFEEDWIYEMLGIDTEEEKEEREDDE